MKLALILLCFLRNPEMASSGTIEIAPAIYVQFLGVLSVVSGS